MKQFIALCLFVLLQNNHPAQDKIPGELSLNKAIEIGLKFSPEIKAAEQRIAAAHGRYWSGISLPQPEFNASFEYVPLNTNLNSAGEKTYEVSQSFEFPTNYFMRGSKFNKEAEIENFKLYLAQRSIVNHIKTSYYKVLTKQYQLKSAEEVLGISEDFLKKAEIKQNVGEGTNLEILTAKVQYTEAKNNLEVSKNELLTAWSELNYTLGLKDTYSSEFVLSDSLLFVDHKISLEQLIRSLESTSPQLKIAELNLKISSVEKGLAWSSLLPGFSVSYFRQTLDGNNGFYGASFGVSVPLWFMFDQRGKIEEAGANLSAAESELQLVKNEIILKLKNAFYEYENNSRQVKLYLNDLLPQTEEIYRVAIKSYDAGELTYLEFLQAKQTLINSRNNYISALFDHYKSVFMIEEIIGHNITDQPEQEIR